MEECQRWVSSEEFSEWISFWIYEAELQAPEGEREPTRDELGAKIHAWAARHNASLAARPNLDATANLNARGSRVTADGTAGMTRGLG